jgi:hypothetical protein
MHVIVMVMTRKKEIGRGTMINWEIDEIAKF